MNLQYRKDNRTTKEFASDIKHRTAKEKFLIELYKKEMAHRGHIIEIKNFGIDNSGSLLKQADCRADYLEILDGVERLLEVKCSPVPKITFKIHNLKQYIKHNTSILVFWSVGHIDKNPTTIDYENTRFGIISPKNIQNLLDTYDHYNEPTFGGKLCLRLYEKDFDMWMKIEMLTHQVI